jgi:hypothetical protein
MNERLEKVLVREYRKSTTSETQAHAHARTHTHTGRQFKYRQSRDRETDREKHTTVSGARNLTGDVMTGASDVFVSDVTLVVRLYDLLREVNV